MVAPANHHHTDHAIIIQLESCIIIIRDHDVMIIIRDHDVMIIIRDRDRDHDDDMISASQIGRGGHMHVHASLYGALGIGMMMTRIDQDH
jgi:hypothetical protein